MIEAILRAPIIPKTHKSNRFGALRFAAVNATLPGPWLEFGVYRGRSARWLLRHLPENGALHLFDSFEGLPESWEERLPAGAFALPSRDWPRFHDPRVYMHVGRFHESLQLWRDVHGIAPALVHIDCDLYESTRQALQGLNGLIRPGCILAFDELYNYKGFENHEYRALTEFSQAAGAQLQVLGRTQARQVVMRVAMTWEVSE